MVSRNGTAAEQSQAFPLGEEHDEDAVAALKQAATAQSSSRPRHDGRLLAHADGQKQVGDEESDAAKALAAETGFPRSVFFIIGNEFCERFSYYGMKAILPLYLTSWLLFSEDRSTTLIHTFNFMAYFFTLFGGILSDSWLGKFRTILYLSIVYCIGSAVLAVTAFPRITGDPPKAWGMAVGLTLLAIGTGGIKPCVSSFGGDQFHPSQVKALALYFSAFYFSINAGSVLSMFITPILRQDVHCLGQESCYPLAFGLPAALMLVATVIFVGGGFSYKRLPAEGNVVLQVAKAVCLALKNKGRAWRARRTDGNVPLSHWLDYAAAATEELGASEAQPDVHSGYSREFLDDVRTLLAVLLVFLPICAFWALYDQQGSRWTYQAIMMAGQVKLGSRVLRIKPEQMGIANAILILVLIPLYDRAIYPALAKMHLPLRALPRMLVGMLLAAASFVMAAILQFVINSQSTFAPDPADPALKMCVGGCVHVLWQLPQYLVLTCGEIMLSITGLEFAYSQAPSSMKSVCQACWLLTVAFGNLLVMILNEIDIIGRILRARGGSGYGSEDYIMAWNFVFWAAVLTTSTGGFALLARRYRYVEDARASQRSSTATSANDKSPPGSASEDAAPGKSRRGASQES